MKKLIKRVRDLLPDRWDVMLIVGLSAFGAGVKHVAGVGILWMYVGLIVVAMAIMGARKWGT